MKTCIVTGKKPISGFLVSHSNRHVKRWLFPAVTKRTLLNPATGRKVTVMISNRGLRTLKKWQREGKVYNLSTMGSELC